MRRFPFETGAQILALGDVFRQDLDGERAVKPGVAGFIDLAHATGSNCGEGFVRAEFTAC